MKTLLFIIPIFLALVTACNSVSRADKNNAGKNDFFVCINAASQSWTAGTPGGGSGTEFYFDVLIKTSDQLIFDSVWIDNRAFALFISKDTGAISNIPVTFSKGDKITLRASALTNKNIKTPISAPPIPFNGSALIGYQVKGKQMYFIIKEIEKKPSLHHQ